MSHLARLPISVIALLVATLLFGCLSGCSRDRRNNSDARKDEGPGATSDRKNVTVAKKDGGPGLTPKPKGPGPIPKSAAFDPDDFEATLRWIALQVAPVVYADRAQNELLADQELAKAHATFAKLAGRKVNWRIKVERVTPTTVHLETYELLKHFPRGKDPDEPERLPDVLSHLAVSASEATLPGEPPAGGEPERVEFKEGLEVGKVISKARATNLVKGDKVLVSGKIAYFVGSKLDSIFGQRSFALFIVEAKSPDK